MKQVDFKSKGFEIGSCTDDELLAWIANKETDPVLGKRSFDAFYLRYSEYLWKVCSIVCRTHPQATELSQDVFQQTMTKVYLSAGSYNKDISSVKTWISKIARNEFLNWVQESKNTLLFLEDLKDIDADEVPYDDSPLEAEEIPESQVEKALSHISEKEKVVVMTYMMYYNDDEPNRHLPDSVLNDLCKYLNTSAENVRKIKSRALKKLKNQLGKPTHNETEKK